MTTKVKPRRVKFSIHEKISGKMAHGRHSGWRYPSDDGDIFVSTCNITRKAGWPVREIDSECEVTCRKCLRLRS